MTQNAEPSLGAREVLSSQTFRTIVSWTLYPFSWVLLLVLYFGADRGLYSLAVAPSILGASLIILYLICEQVVPYEEKWQMTWKSFLSDLKYLVSTSAFSAIFSAAMGYLAITSAGSENGFASHWHFMVQLAACLLIYDAINYSIHRAMHEGSGKFGRFLWMVHAAHHLPPKVYVMMHAVFHPLNVLTNTVLVMILPIWLMGYNPHVIALFVMINSLNGLISHFNVDVRMGWLNYIMVGTELHRYHHSADITEAKNYGSNVPWFDMLFGTFVYRPGVPPKNLGVAPEAGLPDYGDYAKVLALPFRAD